MTSEVLELPLGFAETKVTTARHAPADLSEELAAFCEFGEPTRLLVTNATSLGGEPIAVPTFVNEFWTAKQRQASRLHEISYRACFKPQLPRFFIERLTQPGESVYDPFMGHHTARSGAAWPRADRL